MGIARLVFDCFLLWLFHIFAAKFQNIIVNLTRSQNTAIFNRSRNVLMDKLIDDVNAIENGFFFVQVRTISNNHLTQQTPKNIQWNNQFCTFESIVFGCKVFCCF